MLLHSHKLIPHLLVPSRPRDWRHLSTNHTTSLPSWRVNSRPIELLASLPSSLDKVLTLSLCSAASIKCLPCHLVSSFARKPTLITAYNIETLGVASILHRTRYCYRSGGLGPPRCRRYGLSLLRAALLIGGSSAPRRMVGCVACIN